MRVRANALSPGGFSMLKSKKLQPAQACLLCEKTLDQVGGSRMVGTSTMGVSIGPKYMGGGNPDSPYQSIQIPDDDCYVYIWGPKKNWTGAVLRKALQLHLNGQRAWFCQVCGHRTCSHCGSPLATPPGSERLDDNGCTSHSPILGVQIPCINSECRKYRKMSD